MRINYPVFLLFYFLLFSCYDSTIEQKTKLTGPHATVQLIYFGTGESGITKIQRISQEEDKNILSDSIINKVLVKLDKKPTSESIEYIQQQISVKEIKNTEIVEISFYQEHSDYAIQFLETLVEVLNEEDINKKQKAGKKLLLEYESEIDSIKGILEERNSENIELEELEKEYIYLVEKIAEQRIKFAGDVPQIKMIERPRWFDK